MSDIKTIPIGQLVATGGISKRMEKDRDFVFFIQSALKKFQKCDWGDTSEADRENNDYALETNDRILATYVYPETDEEIWIISEWDRRVTTILFSTEYV